MRPVVFLLVLTACAEPRPAAICTIVPPSTSPLPAAGTSTFEGHVQHAPAGTAVTWSSHVDGPFDGQALDARQVATGVLRQPTPGPHTITLTARADQTTVCEASVTVRVADVPQITITAPSQARFAQDATVHLQATIEGGLGPVTWTSDVDGVIASPDPIDGVAQADVTLSVGRHALTLQATGADGDATAQVHVVMDAQPSAPGVALTTPASRAADLAATVHTPPIHPDGPPLVLHHAWHENGEPVPLLTGDTVPAARLRRGSTWSVQVWAEDGLQAGPTGTAATVIANAPPVFQGGFLSPSSFAMGETTRCQPQVSDPDGDAITSQIRWTVNGEDVGGGPLLPPGTTQRGDLVGCVVEATDGLDSVGPFLAAEGVVANAPPVVARVEISPRLPSPGESVTCSAWLSDPEGDPVVDDVSWWLDGVPVGRGATLAAPDAPGARLVCSVVPFDGTDVGEPGTSYVTLRTPVAPHNVLLIVADDVGVERWGTYGMGTAPPPTPHIDALAEEGVLFTRAWSTPMCSPSRAAYLTGRYGFRTGFGRASNGTAGWILADAEVTLPELLQREVPGQYQTATVGKWHLSNLMSGHGAHVLEQGFDHYEGVPGNLRSDAATDNLNQSYFNYEWSDGVSNSRRTGYLTTAEADAALDMMASLEPPWFLHLAFHAAHLPGHVPPRELYSGPTLSNDDDAQLKLDADTEALDAEIGRVLASVPDDTTIIFLSDNGTGYLGASGPYPPDRVKPTTYEGGVRMPLLIAGPWVEQPGTRSSALVHIVDVFATVAEIAGIPQPNDDISTYTDSQSLLPFVVDPDHPSYRDVLYTEYFADNGAGPYDDHQRAVRDERFKLMWDQDAGYELYEIGMDWIEGEDLLASPPLSPEAVEAFERLQAVLDGPRFRE